MRQGRDGLGPPIYPIFRSRLRETGIVKGKCDRFIAMLQSISYFVKYYLSKTYVAGGHGETIQRRDI